MELSDLSASTFPIIEMEEGGKREGEERHKISCFRSIAI